MPLHPSHVTRVSMDASTYDEICVNCGATDLAIGGWGKLADPCPCPPREPEAQAHEPTAESMARSHPLLLKACKAAQLALRATSFREKDYDEELRLLKEAIDAAEGRQCH